MFILKFIRYYDDTVNVMSVVACNHYEVYNRSNGIKTVTTYTDHTRSSGVERHITRAEFQSPDDPVPEGHFHSCYVENENGKTVDSIRAAKL